MNDHLGVSLSALVDGSLDAAERAAAESHLRTCAVCRAEADALRATLEDLRALERPVLSETDRARLRSEVRRARRVSPFALRLGAAATVVAIAAGGAMFLTRNDAPNQARTYAAAVIDDRNYTAETARALLLDADAGPPALGAESSDARDRTAQAPAAPEGAQLSAASPQQDEAGAIPNIDHDARIAECEAIFLGTDDVIRVRRIVSRFEGEPAYLLTYRAPKDEPTHTELWVVSIAECEIRLLLQEKL